MLTFVESRAEVVLIHEVRKRVKKLSDEAIIRILGQVMPEILKGELFWLVLFKGLKSIGLSKSSSLSVVPRSCRAFRSMSSMCSGL